MPTKRAKHILFHVLLQYKGNAHATRESVAHDSVNLVLHSHTGVQSKPANPTYLVFQTTMHLFKDTVGVFALAIVSVNAVTPDAVTTNPTVGPTVITEDKMGAATFVDGYNSTLVVYQALDGSISGLSGAGSPVTELSYTTSVILAAGVARNDTPLAVAVAYGFFNVVSVVSASNLHRIHAKFGINTDNDNFANRRPISSISAPPNAVVVITSTN